MLQHLLTLHANGQMAEPRPAPAAIVTKSDALHAVIGLAAVVDKSAQDGSLPANTAFHAGALLMVIREYVEALPTTGDLDEKLDADLDEMVAALRAAYGP